MLNSESEFDVGCSAFSVGCFLRSQDRQLQDRYLSRRRRFWRRAVCATAGVCQNNLHREL